MEHHSDNKKSRSPNLAAIDAKHARKIVRDVQTKLGAWRPEAVFLRASLLAGRSDFAKVRMRASHLAVEVAASQVELEARLQREESAVANHGLIRDVQRALMQLRQELESLARGSD